ncbi:diguanylate cyclase [Desulfovibrio sp. OttesenSCG-928-F20]|nr:diguanylate cyclase [Desulfovibrio sp. OttesenSCG-928-M16]MDL2291013.1 diguanylate cyclase [Desulfovibrio sp. OttesenSCG-928-F20]
MTRDRRQSILAALSLLALALFFLTLYYHISRGMENYGFSRVQTIARSCALVLDDWLHNHTLATDIVADLADSKPNADRLFADLAHSAGGNIIIYAAMRLDGAGITLFDKSGVWNLGPEAEHYALWMDLFYSASDMVAMRGPVKSLCGDDRELLFLRALLDADGRQHGELALRIPLGVLNDKLDNLPTFSRDGRHYILTDHKGTILACARHEGEPSCQTSCQVPAPLAPYAQEESVLQVFDNVEYLTAQAEVGDTGWRLHVFSPVEYEIRIRPLLTGAFGVAWLFLSGFVLLLVYHSGKHGQYKDLSRRDHLTGVGNRLAFEHTLQLLHKKDNYPICLIILDVDGLKIFNDTFGHKAGDALLRRVTLLLQRCLRDSDSIFRIGGDEFAILLPGAASPVGRSLMDRIDSKAALLRERTNLPPIFISQGLAEATDSRSLDSLFINADKAMYENKQLRREVARRGIYAWLAESGKVVDRREG